MISSLSPLFYSLRAYLYLDFWRYSFRWRRAGNALLAACGALFLIVKILAFFSQEIGNSLKGHWLLFIIVAVLWALWCNRPVLEVACRLRNRDVTIRIAVTDLFSCGGALIIGTNTTFDTEISDALISASSVQGQFTNRYYSDIRHLDHDLDVELRNVPHKSASSTKIGKHREYDIGTVVRLNPQGRHVYMVAIARINNYGRAGAQFEDLQVSLATLWDFIAERGSMEPVAMPVLGSAFGRLIQTRADIIREIIKSFAAACASRQFCDRLTIAIPPRDFYQWTINLDELGDYLRLIALYTDYRTPTDVGSGSAIGAA